MVAKKKFAAFFASCAREVAWDYLTPQWVNVPAKFGAKFYKHFFAEEQKTKDEWLREAGQLDDKQIGTLVQHVVTHWQQTTTEPLPANASQLAREMVLAMRRAGKEAPSASEAAEVLRRLLNQGLRARGCNEIAPGEISGSQRAIGRLVTASMIRRGNNSKSRSGPKAAMPAIEGYKMLRPLGQGSFGKVFLALHADTGERRAIKLGSLADPHRVQREIDILQNANHRHLVRYYEHGELTGNYYWVAMDYVGEHNLEELLAESEKALELHQALAVGEQMLQGLAALHQKQ